MPTVTVIANIKIQIFFNDTHRHHLPHFHANSAGGGVVVNLENFEVLAGSLGQRQMKKVLRWAEDNHDLLIRTWNRCNPDRPY